MTKIEYIQKHPKSMLADELRKADWPDDTPIEIVGGLNAPRTKCSNLYKALQRAKRKEYVIGGHRQRGTEGWWMAVA